jgi:hypothetical protein
MDGNVVAYFGPRELVGVLGSGEAILGVNHGGCLFAHFLDDVIAGMADDPAPVNTAVAFRDLDASLSAQSHLGDGAGFQEGLLPECDRGGLGWSLESEWRLHEHLRKLRLWGCSAEAVALRPLKACATRLPDLSPN